MDRQVYESRRARDRCERIALAFLYRAKLYTRARAAPNYIFGRIAVLYRLSPIKEKLE